MQNVIVHKKTNLSIRFDYNHWLIYSLDPIHINDKLFHPRNYNKFHPKRQLREKDINLSKEIVKWFILSLVFLVSVCISFVWLTSLWEQSRTKLMQKKSCAKLGLRLHWLERLGFRSESLSQSKLIERLVESVLISILFNRARADL